MTQEPRTTESESRDNAAIREIMHRVKELTVPDRATLALGIIGNLATVMNGRQIEKLLVQLADEAAKVQDVPPSRQRPGAGQSQDQAEVAARGSNSELQGDAVGQEGRGAVSENRSAIL
jgi:hypothetical protein